MRKPTRRELIIGGVSLAVTIALSVVIIHHAEYVEQIAQFGYLGLFIVSVLTNGTFILPGFGIVLTFTMGGVLNPAIVGAVAGIGEATGAIGAYFTGYAGRGLIAQGSSDGLYARFANVIERHGSKAIFFVSSVLSPLFYPFAVFLGALRFGWIRFFLATWAGRTAKSMVLAYLGYYGLRSVLHALGVNV
jgi:membrane protein DedA with SNARE-associated domain